jgi:hypothetical protein
VHCEAYIGYPFDEKLHYISLMDHTFQPCCVGNIARDALTRITPVMDGMAMWRLTRD